MEREQEARNWRIVMGDHTFHLVADSYEHAVRKLEARCIADGIERRGAGFFASALLTREQPGGAMSIHHRERPARVRCSDCGSTRVRGITLGYLEGPLSVNADGRAYVMEGEWFAHDSDNIEGGSVMCSNCGGCRYRIEGARREAVMSGASNPTQGEEG